MKRLLVGLLILGSLSSFAKSLKDQYEAAKSFAYSPSGLDMSPSESAEYAEEFVKYRGVVSGKSLKDQYEAAKSFAYSPSGLDMSSSESAEYAEEFVKHRGILK